MSRPGDQTCGSHLVAFAGNLKHLCVLHVGISLRLERETMTSAWRRGDFRTALRASRDAILRLEWHPPGRNEEYTTPRHESLILRYSKIECPANQEQAISQATHPCTRKQARSKEKTCDTPNNATAFPFQTSLLIPIIPHTISCSRKRPPQRKHISATPVSAAQSASP